MADQVVSQTLSPRYDSQEELRPLSSGIKSLQGLTVQKHLCYSGSVSHLLEPNIKKKNHSKPLKQLYLSQDPECLSVFVHFTVKFRSFV